MSWRPAAACLVAALLTPPAAHARVGAIAPGDAAGFAWQMAPGAQVPLGTELRDETGRPIRLRDAGAARPIILDLGYFHCTTLCGLERADLIAALAASGLVAGRDYALAVISIDPAETPADAAAAKRADLAGQPAGDGPAWHFLTGAAPAVAAIEAAVGFRAEFDDATRQFLHPAGLVVLSTDGIVSSYLLGLGYSGGDLRAAVLRAAQGEIARAASPVLLLCFHFDATTGRYTLAIEKILRLMGAVTVLTVGGVLIALHRAG